MITKYRVNYYESESGWGNDSWTRDFDSEALAQQAVKETNDKYCSSASTPDYYIQATYKGPVQVT